MKQKLKNTQRGITLVALVITIIVLLILAIVSIKMVIDGGLTTKAADATKQHTIATEEEAIQTGYAAYQIELKKDGVGTLTIEGNPSISSISGGWNILFDSRNSYNLTVGGKVTKQEKTEDEIAMEKYALGDDLKGKALTELMNEDMSSFKKLNEKDVTLIMLMPYTNQDTELYYGIYVSYSNKIYRILFNIHGNSSNPEGWTTKNVTRLYDVPSNTETIKYSYDGTKENEKDWIVLYKDEVTKTAEILSPELIGNLVLGVDDIEAQGNTEWEKAVYSYNHAIERINNYTASLITNPNKISVRSVGSNPNNPNYRNIKKYTSESIEEINGILEMGENNSEQDLVMMGYMGIIGTGDEYWLASRRVEKTYGASFSYEQIVFMVNTIDEYNDINGDSMIFCNSYGSNSGMGSSNGYPVRPVVKIKLN